MGLAGDNFYERYWTDENLAQLGAKYRTEQGFLTPYLKQLLEQRIPAGTEILDVGCGDGRTTGVWAQATGRRYIGVDVSAEAVARAQNLDLDVRKIDDATSLPFKDNTFQVVTCIEVLEHLFLPQLACTEILRVLQPGGQLIAATPNVAYWRRRIDMALLGRWNPLGDDLAIEQPWRDPHIRFFGAETLARMLKGVGFRSVRIGGHEGTFIGDIPLVRRARWMENPDMYHRLEMAFPSVFAKRLSAVAVK